VQGADLKRIGSSGILMSQEHTRRREILVISSCTARKARPPQDPEFVAAADLYRGEQHLRLMSGVVEYRRAGEPAGPVRLRIVSAGLGLVDERELIRSYDETFTRMPHAEIAEHAATLGIPKGFADELGQARALTILALGDAYLRACAAEQIRTTSAPVLALTSEGGQRRLPAQFIPLVLGIHETRRFHAGFVALKGAVVAHLLRTLTRQPTLIDEPQRLAATALRGE
jgi:hypothetical protein